MVGNSLSHYKITAELGRGGMGIVYKAMDTKLDREVAIKVLPSAALASDEDRERFYREAKAAAQLHHPHIASVFEIDEAIPSDAPQGTLPSPFIVMEFVDGCTLRDEINKGPMKLSEAVRTASQVAEALKLSHSKEIVHRDIKSHNVMLTREGDAKVLDFGLAKTAQSTMLTRMGSTLGTAAYMSPEQARGESVDHRTDLWSLGVMLFEMVAGRLPFAGEYEKAVMYGILNELAPPLTSLRTGVPMGLEWIVSKCLAKNPDERYQNAADLIVDLKTVDLSASGLSRTHASVSAISGAAGATDSALAAAEITQRRTAIPIILAAMGALLLVVAGVFVGRSFFSQEDDAPKLIRKYSMELSGLTRASAPDISPDGKWMVVRANDQLGWSGGFRIALQTGVFERVAGTKDGFFFRYSPDGDRLLFAGSPGALSIIPAVGGSAIEIGQTNSSSPAWLPDGTILYGRDNQIWRVSASGDNPEMISSLDSLAGELGHFNPYPLPDGRHVLMHMTMQSGVRSLAVLDLDTGQHKTLGAGSSPRYVPSGHLLFFDGQAAASGQLLIRPFDLNSLEFAGSTTSLAGSARSYQMTFDQYGTFFGSMESTDSATRSGESQLYRKIEGTASFELTGISGTYSHFRISPDGERVAVMIDLSGQPDYVLVIERESGVQTQINFSGDADYMAWSSDSEKLFLELDSHLEVFSPRGAGKIDSYSTGAALSSFDVSPDGSFAIYVVSPGQGLGPLRLLSLPDSTDVLFLDGSFSSPRISPDGKFVAYHDSDLNVYVKEIDGDGLYLASRDVDLARRPVWGPNGDYLYFDAAPSRLVRFPISLSSGYSQLSRVEQITRFSSEFEFDISDDNEMVVLSSGAPDEESSEEDQPEFISSRFDVIVNWFDELKALAPRDDR